MKKIIYILLGVLAFSFTSCEKFLETEPKQQILVDAAYNKISDAQAALNGLYNQMGNYRFVGNYVIAINDFASDISVADGSSGHFVQINNYTIADYTAELTDVWTYGYKIISGSTTLLKNIDGLINTYPEDANTGYAIKAQAYALRAFAYFKLVNLFGLPYGTDSNPHGGLVLMDKEPIAFEAPVSRSSVADTYTLILNDIAAAKEAYSKTTSIPNQYYMNLAAVYALNARVNLFMKDYENAKINAQKSLDLRKSKGVSNSEYIDMWKTTAISGEDIFTIVKSSDDNLSANSLNTLYNSYKGTVTTTLISDFGAKDLRLALINKASKHPMKYDGISSSAATSNIPQFRISEMYLIIAESEANLGNLEPAQTALLYTAKRDSTITTIANLPSTANDLKTFIAKERKREFFGEGHRWFDTRRTGETINVYNNKYKNFNIAKFVYPIPADEINSGFKCEQNEGWSANLPK